MAKRKRSPDIARTAESGRKIYECSVRAKELNKQRKHIKDQIAEENKKKLYDAVVKSGLSAGQCIDIIDDYILNDTKSE